MSDTKPSPIKLRFHRFAILLYILVGCNNDNDDPTAVKPVMIAVGTYSSGGIGNVVLWKDSTEFILTSDLRGTSAVGNGLFVANGNIYIAGAETINGKGTARSWLNESLIPLALPSGDTVSVAHGIYAANGSVHTVGILAFDVEGSNLGRYNACYWKDGVRLHLDGVNTASYSYARHVVVDGDDVYIAGSLDHRPVYWKNGDPVFLSSNQGSIGDVQIVDGTVYAAGWSLLQNFTTKSTYWVNGDSTVLPDGQTVTSIFVEGNDIYMAGETYDFTNQIGYACYWKNKERTMIVYTVSC